MRREGDLGQKAPQDGRRRVGPLLLPVAVCDKILSILDDNARQIVGSRVLPQRIAFKPAVIGFIIAHNEPLVGAKTLKHRRGQP